VFRRNVLVTVLADYQRGFAECLTNIVIVHNDSKAVNTVIWLQMLTHTSIKLTIFYHIQDKRDAYCNDIFNMSRQTINTLFYFLFILKCAVICNFLHKRYYFILFITMNEYSILLQFLSLKFNGIRVYLKQFNLFLVVVFSTALSVNYDKTKSDTHRHHRIA